MQTAEKNALSEALWRLLRLGVAIGTEDLPKVVDKSPNLLYNRGIARAQLINPKQFPTS